MKKVYPRKCGGCGKKYIPKTNFGVAWCGDSNCAIEIYKKDKIKQQNKREKENNKVKKEWHDKNDKISVLEKRLETEINHIARLIDEGSGCISCKNLKKPQGGHYHSVGANKTIRYNLHNIFLQCYSCNLEKSGNQLAVGVGLIEKYGVDYKEFAEFTIVRETKELHWTRDELVIWTKRAKEVVKELMKESKKYSSEERINLRNYYNTYIGIYDKIFI